MSAGAAGAVAAAVVLSQLVPPLLRTVAPYDGAPIWARLVIVLSVGAGSTGAYLAVGPALSRHGGRLAEEDRERPLLALAAGTTPWIAYVLWLVLMTA